MASPAQYVLLLCCDSQEELLNLCNVRNDHQMMAVPLESFVDVFMHDAGQLVVVHDLLKCHLLSI